MISKSLLLLVAVLDAIGKVEGVVSTSPARLQARDNETTNTFMTDDFFNALAEPCKRFSDHLELCPTNALKSTKSRFATAQLFAECLAHQYGEYFVCSQPFQKLKFLPVEAFPAMYNTKCIDGLWKNATLPEIPSNQSCTLPSIYPIMRKACDFDYQNLNGSDCCSSPKSKEPCGKESFNLLACSIQSLHTYIGCTARKNTSDVETCVVDTAPRINFVPIGFQVNSDGQECPKPSKTITTLARLTVIEWVVFLLIGNFPLMKRLYQRLRGQKVQVRVTKFYISMLGFWTSLAEEIGTLVLVGTILSKSGYEVDLFKEFVIVAIRPRSGFLNGILGAIDGGWTHEAITDMITQILLSIFGGYLAFFGALSANHTSNPDLPSISKVYMGGGFVASISTDVVWIWFSVMCILATFCQCQMVVFSFGIIFKVLWEAISAPLSQIKVLAKNAYLTVRRRRDQREEYPSFDMNNGTFKWWYYSTLVLCFILFVGSWMFWTGFLTLSGELYCPGELSKVTLVVMALIFARNIVRQGFQHL